MKFLYVLFGVCGIISFLTSSIAQPLYDSNLPSANFDVNSKSTFSGIYIPSKLKTEVFAGAILVHRNRFMQEKTIIGFKSISRRGIEQAILAILFEGTNVVTRDYFDFQVLHLSSTLNQLQRQTLANEIKGELLRRMRMTIYEFQVAANQTRPMGHHNIVYEKTIAMIPYTSKPGSLSIKNKRTEEMNFIQKLRLLFLEATVLSVSRYYQHVIVTVCTDSDYDDVNTMMSTKSLPIWKVIDLSEHVKDKPMLLPKETMLYVYRRFKLPRNDTVEDRIWSMKEMVYYSESDQILHARGLDHIDRVMKKMNGMITVVPHRMHTTALPKTFNKDRKVFEKMPAYAKAPSKMIDLDRVRLIIENPINPQGSCCDDGRFLFSSCGNWWYFCPNFGLQNYTTWARFGEDGYTLPLGTPHQAKCVYHADKTQCPLPKSCYDNDPSSVTEICEEIPKVVMI